MLNSIFFSINLFQSLHSCLMNVKHLSAIQICNYKTLDLNYFNAITVFSIPTMVVTKETTQTNTDIKYLSQLLLFSGGKKKNPTAKNMPHMTQTYQILMYY